MALAVASAALAATALGTSVVASVTGRKTVSMKAASLNKSFGIETSHNRVTCMATYKITITEPSGKMTTVKASDSSILEAAENAGLVLPFECRSGTCGTCVGKLCEGTVHQNDAVYLSADQKHDGWVLTCVAWPTSNIGLQSHMEEEFRMSDPVSSSPEPNAQEVVKPKWIAKVMNKFIPGRRG